MKKAEIQKGGEIVNRLAERVTLKLFRVGCDEKNFEILKKLPMKASEIEKALKLTAMPTNKRINELMEVGLLYRKKRGEDIKRTDITKEFVNYIDSLKKEVINNMANMV